MWWRWRRKRMSLTWWTKTGFGLNRYRFKCFLNFNLNKPNEMLRLSSIALHQLECIRRAHTHNTNTHSTTYMWTQWSRNGQRSGPFHVQRIPSNALVYLTKSKGISYVLQFVALVRVLVWGGYPISLWWQFSTEWRKYQRNILANWLYV